jgi:hypothetical protein
MAEGDREPRIDAQNGCLAVGFDIQASVIFSVVDLALDRARDALSSSKPSGQCAFSMLQSHGYV